MTLEQTAERDHYAQVHYSTGGVPGSWWMGWKDCIEHLYSLSPFVPEGYFRIGEEVDYKLPQDQIWYQGKMAVFDESRWDGLYAMPPKVEVRRRPAWEPKDGEPILYEYGGYVQVGVFKDNKVYARDMVFNYKMKMRPFSADAWGKPWSEI